MSPLPFRLIDTHAHVYRADLPMTADRRYTPPGDASAQAYEDLCDALGATRSVLVQPSFLGTDNRFLLAVIARKPARFRGVAVVEHSIAEPELARLAAAGIVGIRLNLIGKPMPDFAEWESVLNFVRRSDWHVEIHCEARNLDRVIPPLLARGCRVVVDHFGRPDPVSGEADPGFRFLLSTAASGRVWVKASAAYRIWQGEDSLRRTAALTRTTIEAFSADFVVWGSDWPHTQHPGAASPAQQFEALAEVVPTTESLRRIAEQTPARLFHFDHAERPVPVGDA